MSELESQIEENRKKIHSDAYPMSIGELINLYRDEEIDIHPEFQRIYRWTEAQKSRLIESLLLGIPLPSIFVAQRDDGVWDVVDGVQRLSTIFSFLGILRNENGDLQPPLKLVATDYIPSLDGKFWENDDPDKTIPIEIKRAFKREKIDLKIIKKESDSNSKYELFQRLNTGGTSLSSQEVRNCLLIMLNQNKYDWLKSISEYENFQECLPISTRKEKEQAYMELALRFIIYRHITDDEIRKYNDLSELVTGTMKTILLDENFDLAEEERIFKKVFDLFNDTLQDNSFRKFNSSKNRYEGPFTLAIFEVLAIGVSKNLESSQDDVLKEKINSNSLNITNNREFIENTRHGVQSITRFKQLTQLGITLF